MKRVTIKPFHLVGIGVRTTNERNKATNDITELWQRFMTDQVPAKIPNKVDETVYSLYTDYEGDHTKPYTAMLGCKVHHLADVPDGMMAKSFEGGTYMKSTAKGDLTNGLIVNHWTKLWAMDLDRVYTADFEAFGERAQNPQDAEVDFYVAVQS